MKISNIFYIVNISGKPPEISRFLSLIHSFREASASNQNLNGILSFSDRPDGILAFKHECYGGQK